MEYEKLDPTDPAPPSPINMKRRVIFITRSVIVKTVPVGPIGGWMKYRDFRFCFYALFNYSSKMLWLCRKKRFAPRISINLRT